MVPAITAYQINTPFDKSLSFHKITMNWVSVMCKENLQFFLEQSFKRKYCSHIKLKWLIRSTRTSENSTSVAWQGRILTSCLRRHDLYGLTTLSSFPVAERFSSLSGFRWRNFFQGRRRRRLEKLQPVQVQVKFYFLLWFLFLHSRMEVNNNKWNSWITFRQQLFSMRWLVDVS